MNIWRINLKSSSINNVNPRQFCLLNNIVGVGWRISEKTEKAVEWAEYNKRASTMDGDKCSYLMLWIESILPPHENGDGNGLFLKISVGKILRQWSRVAIILMHLLCKKHFTRPLSEPVLLPENKSGFRLAIPFQRPHYPE